MKTLDNYKKISASIKKLPSLPGVYLFKSKDDLILYIGKAKNLKKRGGSYLHRCGRDLKIDILLQESDHVEYVTTKNELEAMILEAQLIQSNQPKFNVLLKTGQPFIYLVITAEKLPELNIVRTKKRKGTYVGPFIEKEPVRKVYDFLVKTFRLKLCKKKIQQGCLDYHLGFCAGICRPDFDLQAYKDRLELARRFLQQGHAAFLNDLKQQIKEHSSRQEFERARELHGYYQACVDVFGMLDARSSSSRWAVGHDLWILTEDRTALFVFTERNGALKKKHVFKFPFGEYDQGLITFEDCFTGFYRTFMPSMRIVINFELAKATRTLYEKFLKQWYPMIASVSIVKPLDGHEAALIRLGVLHAAQELQKQESLGLSLKKLLQLSVEPRTIDCFDISHKQGRSMVGSCVRFTDGQPDKKLFRHFHIKTVVGQDDYASLVEIVARRYRDHKNLPDLVLIDGGKGQLHAVQKILPAIAVASIAKREETIFSSQIPEGKRLNKTSVSAQLLIALRDYAHHFAISFHRKIERGSIEKVR